jgi:hypothetical protein
MVMAFLWCILCVIVSIYSFIARRNFWKEARNDGFFGLFYVAFALIPFGISAAAAIGAILTGVSWLS